MRVLSLLAAVATVAFLGACKEEAACTEADATKKAEELATKLTELATTNPTKAAEVGPKIMEIATKVQAGGDDLAAACKALDEMAAELAK